MKQAIKDREERREAFAAGVLELDDVLGQIAQRAVSSLGRRCLAVIGPRGDDEARAALARVTEMQLRVEQQDAPPMSGVTDPRPESDDGRLDEAKIASIRDFLAANLELKKWTLLREVEAPHLASLMAASPDTRLLLERIERVVDERGRVRSDASSKLERMRQQISSLSASVDQIIRDVMGRADVRASLSDGSVHRRAGRPVLAVKAKSSGRVKGLVHDRSQTGESVFIEPAAAVEAGNRLAEVRADERRETERILIELSRELMEHRSTIEGAALRVGEFEVALASARWAKDTGSRSALQPGDEGATEGLLLRAARHPLLVDQVARGELDEVVPIDLRLGVEFDMLLITGPNTGGKTLALKTAGLFALMTRCGLPVPALDGTTIPLYDGVVADIGDEQEIRQNLSTFASHLVRVRAGLERATPNTLVLLDELGGGTDPDEGGALGTAILERLLTLRSPTLVSTHIGKLKEFAYRHARAENACAEFDHETLSPRYRLMLGTPGESCALIIARRIGLPASVCDVAQLRLDRREGELEDLMKDVRSARMAAEETRLGAEEELAQARERSRRVDERERDLEERIDKLEAEAQKGIEERVRDAMRTLERGRKVIDQLPPQARREMEETLDAMESQLTGATLTERREAFIAGLGKGSLVYLPRYRQRVVVHRVDRERREVVAKLGSMKVKVSFDEVTPYESL
ncbi:Endonuclease MutS2 [Planctomycetes bacterium Poly30]|uniref:Endonuclease MutS2 n=1 Tax=Saltatorellus ferox TaxID=2528018 RepID=A0A518EUL9_9BACT|nr:Endonuclease MutS2 [Planctomycetes bacterium Poly30]